MVSIQAPKINANDDSVQVYRWLHPERTLVKKGDPVVEVTTSKVTLTLSAEVTGYLEIRVPKGSLAKVGTPLGHLHDRLEDFTSPDIKEPSRLSPNFSATNSGQTFGFTRFSDAATALLREHGLEASLFNGMGLVTTEMISRKIEEMQESGDPRLSNPAISYPYRREPVSPSKDFEIRQLAIGQKGLTSQLTVQFFAEPIFHSLRARNSFHQSLLPLILFEFSRLLVENPKFTSFYEDGVVYFYDEVRMGVAIDTGHGLKVACIADATTLSPQQWQERITAVAMKDLRNELSLDDLAATTVTVTDLSSLGILQFQPLINGKQSCILGIGGDFDLPGQPMCLILNFDHRISTGQEAGALLKRLKDRVLAYKDLR